MTASEATQRNGGLPSITGDETDVVTMDGTGPTPDRSTIVGIVVRTLVQVLSANGRAKPGDISESTALIGEGVPVDSLGLVILLVGVEQALQDQFRRSVILTTDDALFSGEGGELTIGGLADRAAELLARLP